MAPKHFGNYGFLQNLSIVFCHKQVIAFGFFSFSFQTLSFDIFVLTQSFVKLAIGFGPIL